MHNLFFPFSQNRTEGDGSMKSVLGGKGANLAQMCKLGMPIPPGFTISTELCKEYEKHAEIFSQEFVGYVKSHIEWLEQETGKKFNSGPNPLLLSVRSGAEISMPGMMDTILNLGINDQIAEQMIKNSGNPRFVYDSYRRFIEMFSSVVLNIPHYHFEDVLDSYKLDHNYQQDSQITADDLKHIISEYKAIVRQYTGKEIESDPLKQLIAAIEAVLKSWNSERAMVYRKIENIDGLIGTAVNIQSMVFGNQNDQSATGVVFTRNPINGENKMFGEFLVNAQGEDVVAGIRTPNPIIAPENDGSMQQLMPEKFAELQDLCQKLESYFKDMQDIEFTIENNKLYLLQTRNGKRSAASNVKIAVDLVKEGVLSKEEAILSINADSLNQLLHTAVDYSEKYQQIAKGLPASPGAGSGIVVFSSREAEELSVHHKVILVRNDTSPEDIKGMHVSAGIVTARGGMTSHAAVVARGIGKPCICGVSSIKIDESNRQFIAQDGTVIKQGDLITIDGSNGQIILGQAKLNEPKISEEFELMLQWCDEAKRMHVRANAETILDAKTAFSFGAVGIGLCRTEHMFFDRDKMPLIQQMIVASSYEQRQKAIDALLPMQTNDFADLFKVADSRPINIRLLDPPLHEFLPVSEEDKNALASSLSMTRSAVDYRVEELKEANPMLGHRGCRLGISDPEIYKMQVKAILQAMIDVWQKSGKIPVIELMIPLISDAQELIIIINYAKDLIAQFEKKQGVQLPIKLGTMIELPRAALIAGQIAQYVDYFSFGSNDLTQTTYGISRDDIGSFLPCYLEQKIFRHDPFCVIDRQAVGKLIEMAAINGKKTNKNLTLGICGEHGGNPESIEFFEQIGMDYISCSPYRIPIARVAAAQHHIKTKRKNEFSGKSR